MSPEERVYELRKSLKLNQSKFAKIINISQGALSQIESEKIRLSMDTLYRICDQFNISADWIIYGEKDMYRDIDLPKAAAKGPQKDYLPNIIFVDTAAHADYLKNFDNEEYLRSLEAYSIPGFKDGNFRMFEVLGDSMEPALIENDILVVKIIENYKKIEDGTMCVLVSKNGIVVKRVFNLPEESNILVLKSDNEKYKPFRVSLGDLLEIWEVKAKITSEFLSENANEGKIAELEDRIQRLEDVIKKMGK